MSMFILACSSNDDDSASDDVNIEINPPTWIHGTWTAENPTAEASKFLFTKSNVYQYHEDGMYSYAEMIELYRLNGSSVIVEEEVEDDYYSLIIQFPNPTGEVDLRFRLKENKDLIWLNQEDETDESRIFRK